jgi:predicted nucleotidyltransferase
VAQLGDAALSHDERALLERFSRNLDERLGPALHAVWLVGSRARGQEPLSDDSDVDILVLADDATWDAKLVVHEALDDAARALGLEAVGLSFSLQSTRRNGWPSAAQSIPSWSPRSTATRSS